MDPAQNALLNLVKMAHAEIRALREMVSSLAGCLDPRAPINAQNFAEVEAECRRRQMEWLGLPVHEMDALLSEALISDLKRKPGRDSPPGGMAS
jgi:hypothetical protein